MIRTLDTYTGRAIIADERAELLLQRVRTWERRYQIYYRLATDAGAWRTDAHVARLFDKAEHAARQAVRLIGLYRDVLEAAAACER